MAPVAAGGAGMGGGMGMMGVATAARVAGPRRRCALPAPLEYDQDEDVDDEW